MTRSPHNCDRCAAPIPQARRNNGARYCCERCCQDQCRDRRAATLRGDPFPGSVYTFIIPDPLPLKPLRYGPWFGGTVPVVEP